MDPLPFSVNISHSSNTLELRLTDSLDEPIMNESWVVIIYF